MKENIKVYAKADESGDITAVNSSIFLHEISGWIEIGQGTGDRYAYAQGNYFDKPFMTEAGLYRYRYDKEAISEKTQAELEAEEKALIDSKKSFRSKLPVIGKLFS